MATQRNSCLGKRRRRKRNQPWWPEPVITVLERQRQGDGELEDPLENEDVEASTGELSSVVLPDSGAA